MADYIVIFGADVRAEGSASVSLQRRCDNAARDGHAAAAAGDALRRGPFFVATGGVGRHGPAEALVMHDILVEHGIAPQRILLETEARDDTLESVRLCTRLLRRRPDVQRVRVASSSYHTLRCTWLFRLASLSSLPLPVAARRLGPPLSGLGEVAALCAQGNCLSSHGMRP